MRKKLKKAGLLILLLAVMYAAGNGAGFAVERWQSTYSILPQTDNWGLGFGEEGQQPTGNVSAEKLRENDAFYVGSDKEKTIYLTFDCGYENGNTGKILEALKKHDVKATFFVVGHFIETNPELMKQMVQEGHSVGNHTYHHPDMSAISTEESFQKELEDVEQLYTEITGREIDHFYRPPQGKYSKKNLEMAQKLGYRTFFWSLAYVDWYEDKQPTEEEAFDKLLSRIHPGAVVLLHNTSSTNAKIMDELLTKWTEMGYDFGTLDEIDKDNATQGETQKDRQEVLLQTSTENQVR